MLMQNLGGANKVYYGRCENGELDQRKLLANPMWKTSEISLEYLCCPRIYKLVLVFGFESMLTCKYILHPVLQQGTFDPCDFLFLLRRSSPAAIVRNLFLHLPAVYWRIPSLILETERKILHFCCLSCIPKITIKLTKGMNFFWLGGGRRYTKKS